jgi:hypothetical protein
MVLAESSSCGAVVDFMGMEVVTFSTSSTTEETRKKSLLHTGTSHDKQGDRRQRERKGVQTSCQG